MKEHLTTPKTRLLGYTKTRIRIDAKKSRSGKTRTGRLNCTPGNKPCGSRCIPQNWDCRLEGQGTNSELKVYKNDPLSGIASVQRGSKDVAQGVLQGDPARIERGRNSVIRGVVKLSPGDNLEEKKELRRKLTELSTPISAVIGIGIVGLGAHAGMKRTFRWYREGLGRDVDQAAFRSIDTVLDRLPIVGERRTQRRVAGAAAISEIANASLRGTRIRSTEAAASGNLGRLGPLSFRPNASNTRDSNLVNRLNQINQEARNGTLNFEQWKRRSVETLYGATNVGARGGGRRGSIFSEYAANEFLVSKFRVSGSGILGSSTISSMSDRNALVETEVAARLREWGDSMRSDMRLRRYAPREGDISVTQVNRYIREVAAPRLGVQLAGYTRQQRRSATAQSTSLMRSVLRSSDLTRTAAELRREVVAQYDTYFADVAAGMRQNAAARNSPFGDGTAGLARYILRASSNTARPPRILSREYADLTLKNYYQSNVRQLNTRFSIQESTARRIAQSITRSPELPDAASALRTLNTNGFPRVRYGGRPVGQAPPRLPTIADLTQQILNRSGNENMSRAAAQRQARRELDERRAQRSRLDEASPRVRAYLRQRLDDQESKRLGKPCGESHIPKERNCTKTVKQQPKKEESAEAQYGRNKYYRIRQITSIITRTGITGGMAYLALQDLKNLKNWEGRATRATAATIALLGAKSLIREAVVTKNSKQVEKMFNELKGLDGVETETIDKITKFVSDTGLDIQRVDTLSGLLAAGYFTTDKPNRVHIAKSQPTLKDAAKGSGPEAFNKGIDKFLEERQAAVFLNNPSATSPEALQQLPYNDVIRFFMPTTSIGNPKGQRMYLMTHELGHAIHYRGNFATPDSVTVNGKVYKGEALERELRRSTSIYGLSDITRSSNATSTDYYSQGNRLETFSENFALYVGNGKSMKRRFPVSYEWTKQTFEYSLSKPPRKEAKTWSKVAEELYLGTERFTNDERKDSKDSLGYVYAKAAQAAVAGDIKAFMIFTKQAIQKNPEFVPYLIPLFETAQLYRSLKEPDSQQAKVPQRLDDQESKRLGKPCGKSYIPKNHECHVSTTSKKEITESKKKEITNISDKEKAERDRKRKMAVFYTAITSAYVAMSLISIKDARNNAKYIDRLRKSSGRKDLESNIKPKELASSLMGLKGQPGVNNDTIDKIAKFVQDANIEVNRKVQSRNFSRVQGFWSPGDPNILNIPQLDDRKPDIGRIINGSSKSVNSPDRLGVFRRWSLSSSFESGSAEQNFVTTIHELGHAIHGRAGFKTPKSLKINGSLYDGAGLLKSLRKNTTAYGRSDIEYGRYETFAEYFTMYVTAGDTLKQRNPAAWAWTKATVDYALAQSPTMSRSAQMSVVDIIKRTKSKSKFDASQVTASAIALLRQAQTLAVQGKFKELAEAIQNYEGKLTPEQFSAISSLMETATIHAYVSLQPETPEIPEVDITID
jgi:hypothetical protein